MVRRTLEKITGAVSGLTEAAFWLSLFALFSQILALVRDRMLSHHFGVSSDLDIYYAAFKIPDLLFVTVASIVSISALVPLFAKKQTEGEKHLRDATDSIFTVFSVVIVLACTLAWVLMPFLVKSSFVGFSPVLQERTIFLSRVLLLSPLLLGFSNFFGAIVQYEKRFILYSISPLLYNFGIIFGLYFGLERFGINSAVYGVVAGALAHLILQAVYVLRSEKRPRFVARIKWSDVIETAYLSVPRTLALSVTTFIAFFFASLASKLAEGSVAIFNLSFNLQSTPLSLIGVSLSLAAFPALSVSAAKKDFGEMIERGALGLRQIIFWSLPATALIIVLRAHMVRLVLGSGNFNWDATRLTAAVLALFIVSTVFQSLNLFFSRFHYALGKTRWPVIGNIVGGILTLGLGFWFVKSFDIFAPTFQVLGRLLNISHLPLSILSLPLAFSLGSMVTTAVLFFALGRQFIREIWQGTRRTILESGVGALFAGLASYLALSLSGPLFDLDTFLGVLGHGVVGGLSGVAVGALVLYLLGNQEIRFWQTKNE